MECSKEGALWVKMLLDELGFADLAILHRWGRLLRAAKKEIGPSGLWLHVVGDALAELPDDAKKDGMALLVGLIATVNFRYSNVRKDELQSGQTIGSMYPKGSSSGKGAAWRRKASNKDHYLYCQTLLVAGYAFRRSCTTISKELFFPYPKFSAAFPKILEWNEKKEDDPDDENIGNDDPDPALQAYKAFQRRFHAMRKSHASGSAGDVLEAGGKLFADLCKFSGLQGGGINRRITGQ